MSAVIRNRRNIVKYFLQAFIQEPLIGVLLNFNQVRHFQNLFLSCIGHTRISAGCSLTDPVFFH